MPNHHNGGGHRDKIDPKEIEQEYGLSYAFFKHFPELMKLLKKAVAGSWTPQKFQVEVRQTDFYKDHSATWRTNIALKFADPSEYKSKIELYRNQINNLAHTYGAQLSDKAMHRMAERSFMLGLNPDQIRDMLANHVLPNDNGHFGGQLSSIEQTLRTTAMRNGVRLHDEQLQRWMRQIVRGNADQNQFETFIRGVAAKTFTAYGDQISGGMDVADFASPYIQSMANILEMNPGSIDLYDKTIRKALSYKDDKGNSTPMSIADFEDQLRSDSRWQHTQQAKDVARSYANALATMWGVA